MTSNKWSLYSMENYAVTLDKIKNVVNRERERENATETHHRQSTENCVYVITIVVLLYK